MTWEQRVKAAIERGGFTLDDRRRARHWKTCAVGEVTKHARWKSCHADLSPADRKLEELGMDFSAAVEMDNVDKARTMLMRIMMRAERVGLV